MGNHLSRSLLLPHPSKTTIYQATLRTNLLEASAVLRLLFIDPATGYKRHFFLDRDASLTGALEVFAWKICAPVEGLEMRVRGEVVGEGVTVEEVSLPLCEETVCDVTCADAVCPSWRSRTGRRSRSHGMRRGRWTASGLLTSSRGIFPR